MCDFVCPTKETRKIFGADITIWMDTIEESRFDDTNSLFEKPVKYDYRITDYNQYDDIVAKVLNML